MEKVIYVDNNATTKIDEKVLEEMLPYFCTKYGNPSSIHTFGGSVSKDIEKARTQVAELLGASSPTEIIFTGSGTEGANTAIKGTLLNTTKKHLITTKVEHACVMNTYKWLEKRGYKVTYLDVNNEGELDLEQLKDSITEDTALVSIMWANNETGVIFPVKEAAEIVKEKNPETIVFVDAVQAAGKIPMDVKSTKIDLLSIAGHKIHAPKGVGALYVKKGVLINPLIIGGHQERGKRAGTENVTSIIGLGKAAELALEGLKDEDTRIRALRDKLERGILERIYNARVNGGKAQRVPNTTNISFEYIEGELILLPYFIAHKSNNRHVEVLISVKSRLFDTFNYAVCVVKSITQCPYCCVDNNFIFRKIHIIYQNIQFFCKVNIYRCSCNYEVIFAVRNNFFVSLFIYTAHYCRFFKDLY